MKRIDGVSRLTKRTNFQNALKTFYKYCRVGAENRPGKINADRHENRMRSEKGDVEPVQAV